jgi:hypothetical protein
MKIAIGNENLNDGDIILKFYLNLELFVFNFNMFRFEVEL